jgi:glycosyltransferase involved in cell wall biosynthesis
VAQALPHARLLLLGGGSQQFETEIKSLAAEMGLNEQVRFLGKADYDRIPAHLAMCDIFVTASVTEVHPLSVIEALGAGLPVMGIHSVGVGDTVQDGVTGLLASHDLPAFTAKLTRLCLDPNLRKQMGEAARRASTVYDIGRATQLMLGQYETLQREFKPRKGNWSSQLKKLLEEFDR